MTSATTTPPPSPSGRGAPPSPPPRRTSRAGLGRRRRLHLVALLLVALLLVPGVSYGRAMTYPGNASWSDRSVQWVRENGGASVVNTLENWYYTRHAPPNTTPDPAALPLLSARGSAAPGPAPLTPTPVPPLPGVPTLPGEGRWMPGRLDPAGAPAIYTTAFRPDPRHASVLVGAAWVRAGDTVAHLGAGTRQPGGSWPGGAHVPAAAVPSLVATFNSGWKMEDLTGGFYLDGRTGVPLVDGEASVVVDDTGRVTVGQWGRDVRMSRHVVAVRQNLHLVVDRGRPVAGLDVNGNGRWGSPKNQLQFTWRSGLGTDARGDLVYVAGDGLTLKSLTEAMVDAGIVRGMELDIHTRKAFFAAWDAAATPAGVRPHELLPRMDQPADRYLAADQRDFFYLTLR